MDIDRLKTLVKEFQQLPEDKRETTIFDIGVRGHFENPMTEVLSFFCDSAEVHEMDGLVASSIVNIIRKHENYKDILDSQTQIQTEREVITENNKRIDLLLVSDQWVIAIENKIFHQQVNPFNEYERHIEKLAEKDQMKVFVILSPDGKVDDESAKKLWCGISFKQLVTEIKLNLQQHFMEAPFNKWTLVLKDFLLHLENIMGDGKQSSIQEEFALAHLEAIHDAWHLLKNTLQNIREKACKQLEQDPNLETPIQSGKASWFDGLPTTILYSKNGVFEVILFASKSSQGNSLKNEGKHIYFQIHMKTTNSEVTLKDINADFSDQEADNWFANGIRYFRWPANNLTVDGLTAELVQTYKRVSSSARFNS